MTSFAKETLPVSLEEEMRRSYLDYAMSVIVGALPTRGRVKPVPAGPVRDAEVKTTGTAVKKSDERRRRHRNDHPRDSRVRPIVRLAQTLCAT